MYAFLQYFILMYFLFTGEGQWGTEEHVFNRILTHSSHAQLKIVFQQYKEVSGGRCIEEALRNEISGDLLDGLLAIG
jgi:annexin A7/11